jgi:hypothetical protein
LSGKYLRNVAIEREAGRTAQFVAVRLYRRPRGEVVGIPRSASKTWDEWSKNLASARAVIDAETRRPGRKPVPDDVLLTAAKAAREALANEKSTVVAVMDACHVETSTAKKYLRLARKRGFLADIMQRKE